MAKKPSAKKKNDRPKKTGRGKILNAKAAQEQAARDAADKQESVVLKMPDEDYVVRLHQRTGSLRKQARTASGQAGEMIAQGVDKHHLDRKAFAIARGLADMEDPKLAITYRHLLKYLDDLGVTKRATAQLDLFAGGDDGAREDADGDENAEQATDAKPGNFRQSQQARNGKNQDRSSSPLPADQNFEQPPREVDEAAGEPERVH